MYVFVLVCVLRGEGVYVGRFEKVFKVLRFYGERFARENNTSPAVASDQLAKFNQ